MAALISQYISKNVVHLRANLSSSLPAVPPLLLNSSSVSSFLESKSISTVLFDCDGVMYRSGTPIPGVSSAITHLLASGLSVVFVTNSSGSNRASMADKLTKMMGTDIGPGMCLPTCYTAAWYIRKYHPEVKKVFVIGGQGIVDELNSVGITCIGGPPTPTTPTSMSSSDCESFTPHPNVGAVVIGMDESFNYRAIFEASTYLRDVNVRLISTNQDSYDVLNSDVWQPAAGAMVAAVEKATNRKAVNVGKPTTRTMEVLESEYGVNRAETVMVGDRLDTDISFGVTNGCYSALVLSGVTGGEQAARVCKGEGGVGEDYVPSVVIPSAAYLGVGVEFETSKL